MKIHLTRHGQALSFGHHKLLSPLGHRQVERLARRLDEAGFRGRIYASPYWHTLMSGQVMAEVLDTRVHVCVPIREIVGNATYMANCFKGASAEEITAMCDRAVVPDDLPYPWWGCEPETGEDVQRRVAPFLDELCAAAAAGEGDGEHDVCLIGHGASVNAAIRHLVERYQVDDPRTAERRPCFNCTLTTIEIGDATRSLEHFHDAEHLPPEWLTSNSLTPAEVLERQRQRAVEAEATLYTTDHKRS